MKPVVFLVYNRPELTARVFERIRAARPNKLLVVADGPKGTAREDMKLCRLARAEADRVDWTCEVVTNFAEENLGCAQRVSSGLDWAFSIVDEAVVLEDDCLPHLDFFRFCHELLERYRDDARVMAISGDNFQFGRTKTPYSYYFSRYNHCWGWATWRRAWRHFDFQMDVWPEIRNRGLLTDVLGDRAALRYWTRIFDETRAGRVDSWNFRWTLACWAQSGLSILPRENLVSNVGFGGAATHTLRRNRFAGIPTSALEFPLRHPPYVVRDHGADRRTERLMFSRGPLTGAVSAAVGLFSWNSTPPNPAKP